MFDLFGPEMPLPVKFFIAFAIVLALIGIAAWLVRRFGSNRLGGAAARGRQPRLAVIDAATVDGRRRLVLIRRDNVEHLLMIGGPTDVVVEPNIVRAASRDTAREPGRIEPSGRQSPAVESAWPLQPSNEPALAPAPARTYRTPATEEPWHAPEPGARPRPVDNMTGLAADLSARLNPPEAPAPRQEAPRSEAPPPRTSLAAVLPPEPPAPPQTDQNLADMAQQLEAALRRTAVPDGRPPVTDPLAAQPAKPAARPPARDFKMRIDPRIESKPEPKSEPRFEPKLEPESRSEPQFDVRPEPKFDARPEPVADAAPAVKAEPKTQPAAASPNYDNLEEEMANLLGRPPGKT